MGSPHQSSATLIDSSARWEVGMEVSFSSTFCCGKRCVPIHAHVEALSGAKQQRPTSLRRLTDNRRDGARRIIAII